MSRAPARKPEWLALTPPDRPGSSSSAVQPQEIARVLEYSGSALRRPATAPVTADSQPSRSQNGSTLTAEPAYKSALDRLSIGPVVVAAQAATMDSLPSSRLDALLAGSHGGGVARLSSTAAPPPPPNSRQGVLPLSQRPTAASTALATMQQPLPFCLPLMPSAGSAPPTAAAAAVAESTQPAAAMLSPVAKEDAIDASEDPSQPSLLPAQAAGSPAPAPAQPAQAAAPPPAVPLRAPAMPPPLPHAALETEQQEHARPAAPATLPDFPAAFPPANHASHQLDPNLGDQLSQRIELAKVQIRLQLAPMFGLSQALASIESDPLHAAGALEAAAGNSSAWRPSSCGVSAGPAAAAVALSALLPEAAVTAVAEEEPLRVAEGGCASASTWSDVDGEARQQQQQQLQQLGQSISLVKSLEAFEQDSEAGSNLTEARCLAADVRVIAERAQLVDAGLEAPAPQQVLSQALPGGAEAWVGQQRRQAEALVRSECDRLVHSLHGFFDDLLASLQQQQQQHQQPLLQQQPPPVEPGSLTSTCPASTSGSVPPSTASTVHSNPSSSGGDSRSGTAAGADGDADAQQLPGDGSRQQGGLQHSHYSELELAPTAEVLLEGAGSSTLAGDEACWPSAADLQRQPEQQCLRERQTSEQPRAELEQKHTQECEQVHPQQSQQQEAWEQPAAGAGELQPEPHTQQPQLQQAGGGTAARLSLAAIELEGQPPDGMPAALSAAGIGPRQQMPPVQAAQLGPAGLGFGSPIKLPSQQHSPARPGNAFARLAVAPPHAPVAVAPAESPATTPVITAARQQQQDLGAVAKSLTFGAHPAVTEYATPALELRKGSVNSSEPAPSAAAGTQQRLASSRFEDAFMTARSTAAGPRWSDAATPLAATPLQFSSLRSGSSGGSWPAAHDGRSWSGGSAKLLHSGGGSSSSLTTPGSSSQFSRPRSAAAPSSSPGPPAAATHDSSLSPLLGGGSGRDLAGITASIRRMAAELRLKQGAMAAAPLLGSLQAVSTRGQLPEAQAAPYPAPVPAASRLGASSSLYLKPLR
ncbi:hypothetical protein ACK3TF_002733 [Chlorella vulgaris]